MTVIRMLAHRAGLIDKTTPQVVEEWALHKSGVDPKGLAAHQAMEQTVHLAVGAAAGALWGIVAGPRGGTIPAATAFGTAIWGVAFFGIVPALRLARPPWRASTTENAVNVASHAVYGAVTGLVTEELGRQRHRRPTSNVERQRFRVG
jgi:hypothetical protein